MYKKTNISIFMVISEGEIHKIYQNQTLSNNRTSGEQLQYS